MIRVGITRRKPTEPAPQVVPTQVGERQYLIAGQAPTLSKRAKPVRILGNLLIVAGLLMLLGIGGWYTYTQWDNQRQLDEITQRFGGGSIKSDVAKPIPATPTPVPTIAPLKVLTGTTAPG